MHTLVPWRVQSDWRQAVGAGPCLDGWVWLVAGFPLHDAQSRCARCFSTIQHGCRHAWYKATQLAKRRCGTCTVSEWCFVLARVAA